MKESRGKNPLVQVVTNIQYSDYMKIVRIMREKGQSKSSILREALLEYLKKRKA